ncbi:MAG: hypothetical protein WKG00_28530 [Polyangiaceae bacterium]
MFKAIYDSPWHTPAFFWLAAVLFLLVLARHLPWLAAFLVLFTFEIAADALATGGWSPLMLLKSEWMTAGGITFVILGDLRFFLLVERAARSVPEHTVGERPEDATRAAIAPLVQPRLGVVDWATVLLSSLLVPLSSTAARFAFPAITVDSRKTFLTYELMFLVVALVMRFVVLPRRLVRVGAPVRRWVLGVASYEIVQYALWAMADVLILSGVEVAYLLRLVPNSLYYAFFLPFVWWTAPPEARRWR